MKPNEIEEYVAEAIDLFLRDAPDSDFQRGYLCALINVYREAFHFEDIRVKAAEALLAAKTQDAIPEKTVSA